MKENNLPILEIINLIKKRIYLIIFVFVLTIILSFYYNNNYKNLKYSYSLKFEILNLWQTSEINVNYNELLGLARGSILTFIDNYDPNNYNILLGDENLITFDTHKYADPKDFIENLNGSMNSSIENRLNNKLDGLKLEEEIIIDRIKNRFKNIKETINRTIISLKSQKKAMNNQFQNLIEEDLDSSKFKSGDNLAGINLLIKLKTDYYQILSKISFYESINQINSYQELLFITSTSVFTSDDEKYSEAKTFKIFTQDQKFDEKVLENLKARIFQTEQRLKKFKKYNQKIFYSVDNWRIQDNQLSTLEIVMAGILFGILINALLLFLTSNYANIDPKIRKKYIIKK